MKGSDSVSMLDEKTPEQEQAEVAERQGLEAEGVRRRLRLDLRPRRSTAAAASRRAYDRAYREIVGQSTRSRRRRRSASASGWSRPTILAHAIPEVRERYLRPL